MPSPALSDPIALAITDTAGRSQAAREHFRDILTDLTVETEAEGAPQLRDFLGRIGDVLAQLIRLWQHQPTDVFLAQLAAVEAILEAGHNGYLRLATAGGIGGIELARRSRVALILGDALCTLRTGAPGVLSVRDPRALQGSANCASTGGGGGVSLHRHVNVLAKIWEINAQGLGLTISTEALSQAYGLRVDPLLTPSATGVMESLYALGRGLVLTA